MFNDRHLTAKQALIDFRIFLIVFSLVTLSGIFVLSFDVESATQLFIISSVLSMGVILFGVQYHARLTRETMAKMLGKNYLDFCICPFCEKNRNG